MRPVVQTETALGRGNCLAACVASVLELPIEDVPNFRLAVNQWVALQEWLAGRGLFAIRFRLGPDDDGFLPMPVPEVDCILVGDSPRNPVLHSVVGRASGYELAVAHDPHPDGTGLAGRPKWVTFFGKLNPATDVEILGDGPNNRG